MPEGIPNVRGSSSTWYTYNKIASDYGRIQRGTRQVRAYGSGLIDAKCCCQECSELENVSLAALLPAAV